MTPAKAQRTLFAAAAVSAVGVAIAGTTSQGVGGVIVLGGWVLFLLGLHSFGRSEP
jgi:hypothetical protein